MLNIKENKMVKNIQKQTSKDFYKYLGNRLKYYRKLYGYSQEYIAQHLGVTFQQIQKYESGQNNIPIERLIMFTKLLHLSLEEILGDLMPGETKFSNKFLRTLCFAKKLKDSSFYNQFKDLE